MVHVWLKALGAALGGFLLSAASLSHYSQPLALGLVCALTGTQALFTALGGAAGYLLFWGNAGTEGIFWCAMGLLLALALGRSALANRSRWLMPALSGLTVALAGLWLQSSVPFPMYILRIALAIGSARLFSLCLIRRDPVTDWLALGVSVLALSQVVPVSWLSLGFPAAAAITAGCAFPAAALAGLALDLSQITAVPMTAVLSLAWLVRLLPGQSNWKRALAPAALFPVVMALTGNWDLSPLPGLAIGGLLGLLIPRPTPAQHRGETGIAQVRLELTAEVYRQMQQLLLELKTPPIDEQALLLRACERACGGCSFRKSCGSKVQSLSPQVLNAPILDSALDFSCRRTGRVLQELRRSQEHLRLLRAQHRQQEEGRHALMQQYSFLSRHLQNLSDSLTRRVNQLELHYEPEVAFSANRAISENGDRCLRFSGTASRYYVAILDGMGTGIGAADEAIQAGTLLKGMLTAGFPAEHALSSLNSICALRSRAGAVTVDLVELELDSGRASLYKWGAPPSWLIRGGSYEKIGTAGPPPGLLVADNPETAQRLSLRRGEILFLLSDGVSGEDALCAASAEEPLNEQAARILSSGCGEDMDDATVALIRLRPRDLNA